MFLIQSFESYGMAQSACVCGVGVYLPSDLTHRESESRSAPQKSVLFGLDTTRERQIR